MPASAPAAPHSPALELIAVLCTLLALGAESLGRLWPFAAYALLICLYGWQRRLDLGAALRRTARVLPVLVAIAAGLPLSRAMDAWMEGASIHAAVTQTDASLAALSLLLRSACAVLLLSSVVLHLGWPRILAGLRGLGLPASVVYTLDSMERYRGLITAEWRRTAMARESRTPGPQRAPMASYAGQAGMIFLRSGERAERVHQAMLARGFSLDRNPVQAGASWEAGGLRAWLAVLWLPAGALLIRLGASLVNLRW